MIKLLMMCSLVFGLFSCTDQADSASSLLRNFVKKTSSKSLSQDDYVDYLSGPMLEEIEQMSEEDFKAYQEQVAVDSVKFKVLSENCSESECTITYTTKYKSKSSDGSVYHTEVRKLAELIKDESWKLKSVQNIKTYHETNSAINPLKD